jgi:hypothetical protein
LVGSSEAKNVPGLVRFFPNTQYLLLCFFTPAPYRETPKNAIKEIENKSQIGFGFFVDFFVKTFRHDLFVNVFNSHR